MSEIVAWLEEIGFVWIAIFLSTAVGLMLTYGGIKLSKPLRKITLFLLISLIAGYLIYELYLPSSVTTDKSIYVLGGGTISGFIVALVEEIFNVFVKIFQFIGSLLLGLLVAIWGTFVTSIDTQIQEEQIGLYIIALLVFVLLFAFILMKIINSSMMKAAGNAFAGSLFLLYPIANVDHLLNSGKIKWNFEEISEFFQASADAEYNLHVYSELFQARMDNFWREYIQVLLFIVISGIIVQLLLIPRDTANKPTTVH